DSDGDGFLLNRRKDLVGLGEEGELDVLQRAKRAEGAAVDPAFGQTPDIVNAGGGADFSAAVEIAEVGDFQRVGLQAHADDADAECASARAHRFTVPSAMRKVESSMTNRQPS